MKRPAHMTIPITNFVFRSNLIPLLLVLGLFGLVSPARAQSRQKPSAVSQARVASTQASGNAYCLTDADGLKYSLSDAGTTNGGQSLSGTSSTFLFPVNVIVNRQPDNTWSWSITIADVPLVDFTNEATSTTVPLTGWVNEDGRLPFDVSLRPGACPVDPLRQVCVTLCGGTPVTLTELLPGSFSSEDLAYRIYQGTANGEVDTWLFEYTVDETVYEWRATQPMGPTLPPASGWTETSNNGCSGGMSVNVAGGCSVQPCTIANVQLLGSGTLSCVTPTLTLTATGGVSYRFSGPGVVSQFSGTEGTIAGDYLINRRDIPTLGTAVVNQPGQYMVVVTDERGCKGESTINVVGQVCR
jgi:hypothetical protein